jgi:hypothetical protein
VILFLLSATTRDLFIAKTDYIYKLFIITREKRSLRIRELILYDNSSISINFKKDSTKMEKFNKDGVKYIFEIAKFPKEVTLELINNDTNLLWNLINSKDTLSIFLFQ